MKEFREYFDEFKGLGGSPQFRQAVLEASAPEATIEAPFAKRQKLSNDPDHVSLPIETLLEEVDDDDGFEGVDMTLHNVNVPSNVIKIHLKNINEENKKAPKKVKEPKLPKKANPLKTPKEPKEQRECKTPTDFKPKDSMSKDTREIPTSYYFFKSCLTNDQISLFSCFEGTFGEIQSRLTTTCSR